MEKKKETWNEIAERTTKERNINSLSVPINEVVKEKKPNIKINTILVYGVDIRIK